MHLHSVPSQGQGPAAFVAAGGVILGQRAEHPGEREEFPPGCTAIGPIFRVPLLGRPGTAGKASAPKLEPEERHLPRSAGFVPTEQQQQGEQEEQQGEQEEQQEHDGPGEFPR